MPLPLDLHKRLGGGGGVRVCGSGFTIICLRTPTKIKDDHRYIAIVRKNVFLLLEFS